MWQVIVDNECDAINESKSLAKSKSDRLLLIVLVEGGVASSRFEGVAQ